MNALQFETSPYLLQHAGNPVDWYPWGDEALARAKAEDKPIIVSIGYSTCHWCHVMERESFENETTAAFMNEHFVCIKVDREERPDIDHFYMEACQAINGSGGWPLNAFLLPDLRPFYAGTYYPPEPRYQRPSWRQLLVHLTELYRNEPDKVKAQAERLTTSIADSSSLFINEPLPDSAALTSLDDMVRKLKSGFDLENGGYGGAPKFPMTQSLELLLEFGILKADEQCVQLAERGMQAMISGGIYDQIGGGFSRYTVDSAWRVPHFEKMLYDNALILRMLAKLQLWRPNFKYEQTIKETVDWLNREMRADSQAFFSALDADSEGVEGKFYTWTQEELREVLPEQLWEAAESYLGVTEEGNWEEEKTNIFYRARDNHSLSDFVLAEIKQKLFDHRESRIRPGLDDKVILQWNGLMIEALCWCHRALPDNGYLKLAEQGMKALQASLLKDGKWYRNGKDQQLGEQAFLDDEISLASAALELYLTGFDQQWFYLAKERLDYVITNFPVQSSGLFAMASSDHGQLPVSGASVYDNALPSGNSQTTQLLQKMDRLVGPGKYGQEARRLLGLMESSAIKYPTSFAGWGRALLYENSDRGELIITGPEASELAKSAWANSRPGEIIVCAETNIPELSLLENRFSKNERLLYYCRNLACGLPVQSLQEVLAQRQPL
ncbi:MAG: thioredoxin domain-containing protein [Bacteroidota bacterium]